jgi:hypothetical protein
MLYIGSCEDSGTPASSMNMRREQFMTRARCLIPAVAGLLAGALNGCAGSDEAACPLALAPAEAPAETDCWGGGGTPAEGIEVMLGANLGEVQLIEPEQDLVLYRGLQGGVHFFLNARIRGMTPGDPKNVLAANPITLFSVMREDGEPVQLVECAFRMGYREVDECAYELPFSRLIQIENAYKEIVFGERVLIRAEVRDSQGRYGVAERWVRVVEEHPPADAAPDALPDALPDAGIDAAPDAALPQER